LTSRTDPTGEAPARALLESAQRVLVFGHTRPDGDVLGSQVGLAWTLAKLGREVRLINPDRPEPQFDFLAPPVPFEAYEGGELWPHDLAVLVDGSELSRAGALGRALDALPSAKLVIDHHLPPDEAWWDAALIDSSASATGLIVQRLTRSLGVELGPDQATGLFTALATDTGWFRHANTDAETLEAAAELVRAGAHPDAVHRALFRRRGASHPQALGDLLASAELFADERLAYLGIPHRGEGDPNAGDTALEILRSVGSVEVVVLLREVAPGVTKLSARSDGELDVHRLARRFGGGGHQKAAGAELALDLESARRLVLEAAHELFDGESPEGRAR
jgi:phosphoesterase RecJ-like protein